MGTGIPSGVHPVQYYADQYKSYKRRNRQHIVREARNWGMFSGVDFKQWGAAQLQVLLDEGRAPHQVNFLQKHINTLAGNFYQNEFDTDFEPNTGASSDDTLLLKSLYLTDVNRGGWKKSKRLLIRAGLIFRGTVEMFIDYKTDPLGSIGKRYVNHKRMLYDPDWESDDIVDNKHIKQFAWMTPEEIKRVYNVKSAEIDEAITLWEQQQASQSDNTYRDNNEDRIDSFYDDQEFLNIVDGRFLVIQDSRLERGFGKKVMDKLTGDTLPEMSDENFQSMMALRGSELKVTQDEYAKLRINTIVPGLSKTLMLQEEELHEMQIGAYQYHCWSAMNINGEPQGVVDVLKDLQEIYNKRESTFTHWQTTSANGAEFVEEDFFANPTEFSKYVNGKNKPGETYKVGVGKLSQSRMGIAVRPRGDMPSDLHVSADRAFNMTPEVGYTVPALSGGEGKSGESAKLFREKRAQALVSLEPMTKSLQEYEGGVGESYFYLTKFVYGNAPRIVTDFKSKKSIMLNMPTDSGEVENDVRKIRRHSVIITTSRNGETTRRELLDRYGEIAQVIKNPVYQSIIEKQMVNYLPNIPDAEIAEAQEAADMFIKLQYSRMDAEIAQNQFGVANFEKQMQQLNAPPAPPPGAGGQPGMAGPPGPNQPGKTPAEGGGISVEGQSTAVGAGVPVDVNNVNQLK